MKKTFNRKISIVPVLIVAMLLAACDNVIEQQTATPTATATPCVTPTVTVTVCPTPTQTVTALVQQAELFPGESINATDCFSVNYGDVIYSLDGSAAKLENGMVTAIEAGQCELSARSATGDSSARVTITVLPLPSKKVQFEAGEFLSIIPGQSIKMAYSCHDMYKNKVKLERQSDCISFDGSIVTAVSKGVGSIIATVDGEYAGRCTVVVGDKEPLAPLGGVFKPDYIMQEGILTSNSTQGDNAVIMLTGDIMCLSAQQNAVKKNGKYDFSPSFKYVKSYFEQADFVMGNLESIMSVSHPYANQEKNIDGKPNCNGPSTLLDALRGAGYDAVATANNHSLDAGEHGLYETLERLEFYRLHATGTFAKNQKRYLLVQINGIKVAFMSYTDIMNKRGSVSAELYNQIIGAYSKENVERDCKQARQDGAEFIVAYMHWGRENTHDLISKQKTYAKEMANAGVDVIAGSHPHCLQPAEYITATDGRKVLCLYSMGNFVSSMARDINNDTAVFRLELEKTKNGVKLKSAGYLPCRVTGNDGDRFVILPCDKDTSSAGKSARARIDALLGDTLDKLSYK